MKKITLAFICLGLLGLAVFGQSNRSTRPRVAATPAPPTIKGDNTGARTSGPPVLRGGANDTRPSATPTPKVIDESDDVIRVETNLVTMPVSVLDRDGRFVTGLQQKDFQIFENGVQQKIDYFQSVEQPFTVILMIDVSPSTAFRINDIQDAAIEFIDQLRPTDKVMVISFDQRVHVLSSVTANKQELRDAVREAQFGDGTSLYEAVDYVISRELNRIEGRKAVVIFTDGVDTTSRRATYQSTVADVEEVDALFYPIRYDTQRANNGGWGGGGRNRGGTTRGGRNRRGGGNGGTLGDIIGIILNGGGLPQAGGTIGGPIGGSPEDYETGRKYLESLAANSGGRKFEADSIYNLDASFAGIAEELRRQYSLGYYPEKVGTVGERKQIRVRVDRPNLVVRAKNSYIVGDNGSKFAGK